MPFLSKNKLVVLGIIGSNTDMNANMTAEKNNIPAPDLHGWMQAVITHQDKKAFAKIFHYFAPRLKSFFMQQHCSEEQAEEIIQQTLLTVWEKAPQFDPKKAKLSTWVYTIARRKKIDIYRQEQRHGQASEQIENIESESVENQEAQLEQQQRDQEVHDALSSLPTEQAKLLRMSFFDQLSHQKISEKLNLPLGTVKSRMRLAIEKLRHRFYKKEDTHA